MPPPLLKRVLRHMSAEERALALRQRLVPITWLPHVTLYADAAPSPDWRAQDTPAPVVARISSAHFLEAARKFLKQELLAEAANGLRSRAPVFSAFRRISSAESQAGLVLLGVAVLLALMLPFDVFYIACCVPLTLLFLSMVWLRLMALLEPKPLRRIAPEMDDRLLPVYSVLVPVFRETRVLPQLLGALMAMNYPAAKLDIKLILEEIDTAMQRAVARLQLPAHFEVLIVPAGKPQTKPRALNYALQFARGHLLTIYDAEDIPEPMQLRCAARMFAQQPQDVACLQAELAFYNPNENWLTRQFTLEYATLFKLMLPMLAAQRLPLPLSGTSNHFRVSALAAADGWDPYNVTEDADLGFRLARLGYRTAVLPSITYEEANSRLGNWMHQRSRWLKGFLQTWLVHMRSPRALVSEIGLAGFVVLQATVLGVFAAATLHPLFLLATAYTLYGDIWHGAEQSEGALAWHSLFIGLLLAGMAVSMFSGARAAQIKGLRGFGFTVATMPFYWLLASLAGWQAVWQFLHKPYHWNKTQHGLSRFQQTAGKASGQRS
ncbi:MAG: glycosyltransferase [Alphaproteobacteria bacterium]|nr:glycosyltransferase [Alphaproteobacteria bacterium]